jgi:predicted DCC family thiol-disulfide oxidoreductase YuxK
MGMAIRNTMSNPASSPPVIFFDGVCNLCNGFVQFTIKRDKKSHFKFASLQSETAKKMLPENFFADQKLSSVVLLEDGKFFSKSTAALHILRGLDGPLKLLYAFIIVPPVVRNLVYDVIARYRYRWFGKRESCMIPTPELKNRFLD